MSSFDGLLFHEKVLLVLGAVLFAVLLFILVYYAIHKRSLKSLLAFFLLPIAMIGYPSIQKISYSDGVLEVEKQTGEAEANPRDSVTRNTLKTNLRQLEQRPTANPDVLLKFAKANAAIGDTTNAVRLADSVLKIQPNLRQAVMLKRNLLSR
ncbi:MAG TPA: hypothetical protein VNL73_05165 [Verrucomicrobiae bacterium]|nr:hypothetical protein [Verrucomicrobiae bacterium]